MSSARRSGDGAEPLPAVARLLKAADWSAVYCVVAEPDWHESPGVAPGTDQSIDDVWESEDEIRKAAHRFMANGGLVTKMHESLEPYGQLVENAVALADFSVNGETIRKGSWYIAIEPTAEGKAAIEKGEFTGVSIEGFAHREEVEKRSFSTTDNRHTMEEHTMRTVTQHRLVDELAEVFAKCLGLPSPQQRATMATGHRIAKRIADELAEQQAPAKIAWWCEREGVDPMLAGVFGPSQGEVAAAAHRAIAKEDPDRSAKLRKAYEQEGMDPALAGLF